MADPMEEEHVFDIDNLPTFLHSVLDSALELNNNSDRDSVLNYLELLCSTIELLDDLKEDGDCWDDLSKKFREIYIFIYKSTTPSGA